MDENKKSVGFSERALEKIKAFMTPGRSDTKNAQIFTAHFQAPLKTVLNSADVPDEVSSPEELDDLIKSAYDLLKKSEKYPSDFADGTSVRIIKLGKPRISNVTGRFEAEKQSAQIALRMADTLSSLDREFSLRLNHRMSGDVHTTEFCLCGLSEKTAEALIRSTYQLVDTEPGREKAGRTMKVRKYAVVNLPIRESEAEKNNGPASWVSAVSSAAAILGECEVEVRFIPLKNDDPDIQRGLEPVINRFKDLCSLRTKIDSASDLSWNVNSSYGANKQVADVTKLESISDRLQRLGSGFYNFFADFDFSANISDSSGITVHRKDKVAESVLVLLDREIQRLAIAIRDGAWKAVVCVSAEDEDTSEAVRNAFSGALRTHGLETSWSNEEHTALTSGRKELMPLMMFPTREFNGLEFSTQEEFSLRSPAGSDDGLFVGSILWNGTKAGHMNLPTEALDRHTLVCGMTGTGKTNTVFTVLNGIGKPFLVIEPVKEEYRAKKKLYPNLKVYTMKTGAGTDAELLRLNPFWFPKGTKLAFHIDSIKAVIASAFELSAAMPNILEQCLYNVYVRFGWNLVSNENVYAGIFDEKYLYPTIEDLVNEIDAYLKTADFGDEVKGNYRGAMSSRLKSFLSGSKGILLNTRDHPDYDNLRKDSAVLELEGLADDSDKCLVMGTVLIQYFECLKLNYDPGASGINHVIVVEEAHRLFKNVPKQAPGSEGSNVIGQLVDSLSNIMAEIRAFGEGLVVVDQSPSKLAEDVIKNSATKIIHRIDSGSDIQLLLAAMLLPDSQNAISDLKRGEALIRTEGMSLPCKTLIDLAKDKGPYRSEYPEPYDMPPDPRPGIEFASNIALENPTVLKTVQLLFLGVVYTLGYSPAETCYDRILKIANKIYEVSAQEQNLEAMIDNTKENIADIMSSAARRIKSLRHAEKTAKISAAESAYMQMLAEAVAEECFGWSQSTSKPAAWMLMKRFATEKLSKILNMLDLGDCVINAEEE